MLQRCDRSAILFDPTLIAQSTRERRRTERKFLNIAKHIHQQQQQREQSQQEEQHINHSQQTLNTIVNMQLPSQPVTPAASTAPTANVVQQQLLPTEVIPFLDVQQVEQGVVMPTIFYYVPPPISPNPLFYSDGRSYV